MVAEVQKLFDEQFGPQELIEMLDVSEARAVMVIVLGKDERAQVSFSTMATSDMCFIAKLIDLEINDRLDP